MRRFRSNQKILYILLNIMSNYILINMMNFKNQEDLDYKIRQGELDHLRIPNGFEYEFKKIAKLLNKFKTKNAEKYIWINELILDLDTRWINSEELSVQCNLLYFGK